ncbi:MAG: extracellular solute-binding protein [Ardenticatenales bacterium]|nr:extracellular solute-binding protein [Ardenticatenales bacterium]
MRCSYSTSRARGITGSGWRQLRRRDAAGHHAAELSPLCHLCCRSGLAPLGDYLDSSDQIAAADFYANTLDAFRWDGELWCIPQNLSSLVVYYNADLFAAAGLPLPADDWYWDDFLAAARALTLDLDGDGRIDQYGAGIEPALFRLAPFVWQLGGEIVDDPAAPGRLTLDEPAALEAFQWFVDLQVQEGVVPDATAEAAETSESRFLNGRLAMYFNSAAARPPTGRSRVCLGWGAFAAAEAGGGHPPRGRLLPGSGGGQQGSGLDIY